MRNTQLAITLLIIFFSPLHSQYSLNVKRTFFETNHQIYHAGYSDKGNYIVTTGSDNSIIIWNAETGIIYRTLAGLKKRPLTALYSEKKNLVLSGGEDMNVTLWDPVTLKITAVFKGHTGSIKTLDMSPDKNCLVTGSSDNTLRVWDLESKNLIYELKAHKKEVNAVQFSPDGTTLVSGGADKKLILWSMKSGSIIASTDTHKGWIRDVKFSPDGKKIASCGDDKMIKIWNADNLDHIRTLSGHNDWVQAIDFTPDGKYLISGGHDQLIIIWNIASGEVLYQSQRQGQIILSVDICPYRSDVISASLLSEELKTWAISGPDEAQWKIPAPDITAREETESLPQAKIQKDSAGLEIIVDEEHKSEGPQIELFSPSPVNGRIISNENEVVIIGKVSDPEGVNTFMMNKKLVRPSEAGVFEHKLFLQKGENRVQLEAINNSGNFTEKWLLVDCKAEFALTAEQADANIRSGIYYALIIAVNEYQDDDITDLDNPVRDAEDLHQILIQKYTFDKENIILLKNPSYSDMIISLDELSRKLTEQDNLLIFYAGHGFWDEKGNVGYWMPSDADKSNTANWFRNSTLRDFIGSIQTRHTLVIADACFSGAIFKTRAAFTEAPKGIQKLNEIPSRKAMTSGILQEVPDKSVFLEYLLKRLEENQEKFLPSEILFSSFKTAVMNNSPNVPQYGIIQNVGDEGGDFIFISR
ncbi:MAG: caspase family protein [Bacteroidales bacterium]|nr:caspase family protein [Bacteroidales bacterium]